jgi:hypothetical protein
LHTDYAILDLSDETLADLGQALSGHRLALGCYARGVKARSVPLIS